MENIYVIQFTEREIFLLIEGLNELTNRIWEDVPRGLSDELCEAVKSLDGEIDSLRHILANSQPWDE